MILRLDPAIPLVWRSPFGIQLGIDPPIARVDDLTPTQEKMLAALVAGISDSGLLMLGSGHDDERERLVSALAPALVAPRSTATPFVVALSGVGPLVTAIADVLARDGVTVLISRDARQLADRVVDLAIVVGSFVVAPDQHAVWLRRDVAHLGVVVAEGSITVGPLVIPGQGPCLHCLELHRRDDDPAWPAIATQLLGRVGGVPPAIVTLEAVVSVARMIVGSPGISVRVDAITGQRRERAWHPHPHCGCRGLVDAATTGRRESDWASAALSGPAEARTTSSARAIAAPA